MIDGACRCKIMHLHNWITLDHVKASCEVTRYVTYIRDRYVTE